MVFLWNFWKPVFVANVFFPDPEPGASSVGFFRTRATKRAIKRSCGKSSAATLGPSGLQQDPGKKYEKNHCSCAVRIRKKNHERRSGVQPGRCGGFPKWWCRYHPVVWPWQGDFINDARFDGQRRGKQWLIMGYTDIHVDTYVYMCMYSHAHICTYT